MDVPSYDVFLDMGNKKYIALVDMDTHFIGECPACRADGNPFLITSERYVCASCNMRGRTKDLILAMASGFYDREIDIKEIDEFEEA